MNLGHFSSDLSATLKPQEQAVSKLIIATRERQCSRLKWPSWHTFEEILLDGWRWVVDNFDRFANVRSYTIWRR